MTTKQEQVTVFISMPSLSPIDEFWDGDSYAEYGPFDSEQDANYWAYLNIPAYVVREWDIYAYPDDFFYQGYVISPDMIDEV